MHNCPSVSVSDLSISLSDICQLDGNMSISSVSENPIDDHFAIPVLVSDVRTSIPKPEVRQPVRKSVRRNNLVLQSVSLPTVMNINPRSIYNKSDEFPLLLEQYEADIICMSESWEQKDKSLEQLLDLPNYQIITNVKQRDFKGGKPAILVNEKNSL